MENEHNASSQAATSQSAGNPETKLTAIEEFVEAGLNELEARLASQYGVVNLPQSLQPA